MSTSRAASPGHRHAGRPVRRLALYFQEGRPVFSYTVADGSNYRAVAADAVPAGKHSV